MRVPITEMSFPTRMVAGPGAVGRMPAIVQAWGVGRVLLVSDPGLERAGIVARVQKALRGAGLEVVPYLGVSPNPVEADVLGGLECFQAEAAEAVVGLGGGAPMDVAKAVAMKVNNPAPLARYDDQKGGSDRIVGPGPKVVCVPTTAGTGSELGRASVIALGKQHRKVIIFSPFMLPDLAVLDAELTVGLPPALTAQTGLDALTHALEAYVARGEHPFADMFALNALARVGHFLPRAVDDGADLRARHEMLLAASQGATAFQKGLGACHALAHPLSAVAGVHHGLANAIMLPHVARTNLERGDSLVARRYEVAARALGLSMAEPAPALAGFLTGWLRRFGLPERLRDAGVQATQITEMVKQAKADAALPGNPVDLDAKALRGLYQAAL